MLTHANWMRDRLVEQLRAIEDDGAPDLTIRMAVDGDRDLPTFTTDYVAVVSRRLIIRAISSDQLRQLWTGEIGDWSALGSPVSQPVVRVAVNESAGPFDAGFADQQVPNRDDLATYLEDQPGALAIIPAHLIDFRFRTLRLDGVTWFRPGDATWPLQVTMVVDVEASQRSALAERVTAAITPAEELAPVSMTWAGDIILGRRVHAKMLEYGDWAAPFRSIADELTWADVTISNLECAISDAYETPVDPKTFDFKTDPPAMAGLELAQIDVLSRANNHAFNFGPVAMEDTTALLDAAGIKHFGIGRNIEEARQASVVEVGGVTYAFLGYNGISDEWDGAEADSPGTNPLLDWLVVEDIRRELAAGHIVIPFFHWGIEYVYDPTEEQRYFAQVAIDTGAAMVMGSHPHWVQAVETYKGKSIVYSLGNFVFDQEWSIETKQGMMADVWMRGDTLLALDLVPILIEDYHKPRRMSDDEAWPVLGEVWAASDRIRFGG
ncbi:MAG: CapA family protein [Thermomicrobiales bacterium]|nr:CapA family protein [Thermomicrobiales bacterium]